MPTIDNDTLHDFARQLLVAVAATDEEARIVADVLVSANLAGHDSHGVIRLEQYARMVRSGQVIPGAQFEVQEHRPRRGGPASTASVDGHWGFGAVVATRATRLAIRMAEETGVAVVSVRRANHVSRLGHYVLMAAEAGFVALMTANNHGGGRWVAPFGGTDRRLSTNPIAFAAPLDGDGSRQSAVGSDRESIPAGLPTTDCRLPSLLVDITTSTVAEGKVRVLRNKGLPMPEGWAIYPDGAPLTDPAHMYGPPHGSLLPFGGSIGHKGFALSIMVELLSGALSGAGCSGPADPQPGNALFLLVLDPAVFGPPGAFQEEAGRLVEWVKGSPPAPGSGGVLAPGEPEFRETAGRRREGIPLDDETWRQLRELAAAHDVPVPATAG
jgi:LDH2 family malate/lactate/ureidoglycolate dehydrogenase